MDSTVALSGVGASAASAWFKRLLWLAVILMGVYYLATAAVNYLTLNEEHYGPYFWPRASMLFPHVIAGAMALVIGPFQFWTRIRNKYKKIHRVSGRVYLLAILVGSLAGFGLAITSQVSPVYSAGLFGLSSAWFLTSCMAFISIRNRNINQHRQWMIRSYVVTFAFVTFRIISDLLSHYGILEFPQTAELMSWVSWAIPLLFAEVALQWNQAVQRPASR